MTTPPVAFHFKVVFPTIDFDTSFEEVSGIGSELETEAVQEGGENRFVHRLPKAVKHQNLVLKRGVADLTSPLVRWCQDVLEGDFVSKVVPCPVSVMLLDEMGLPLRAWSFTDAYPVKWEIDPFGGRKNELAIEKIELGYAYSNRLV